MEKKDYTEVLLAIFVITTIILAAALVYVSATSVRIPSKTNMKDYVEGKSELATLSGGDNSTNWCNGADINRDGNVNFADLTILKRHWLANNTDDAADINKDGNVNFADLAILKANFFRGDCAPLYNNTCLDSDGGIVPNILGNVSGYYYGTFINVQDSCITTLLLDEQYCSANDLASINITCSGNYTKCSSGRCI